MRGLRINKSLEIKNLSQNVFEGYKKPGNFECQKKTFLEPIFESLH